MVCWTATPANIQDQTPAVYLIRMSPPFPDVRMVCEMVCWTATLANMQDQTPAVRSKQNLLELKLGFIHDSLLELP
eukprot:scaffold3786_cov204-Alexandrium_tamarense.AAC.25